MVQLSGGCPAGRIAGERVYLEDLIEDVVGGSWNQGDTYRLASCVAVWNGKEFELEFDPERDQDVMIG